MFQFGVTDLSPESLKSTYSDSFERISAAAAQCLEGCRAWGGGGGGAGRGGGGAEGDGWKGMVGRRSHRGSGFPQSPRTV